MSAQALAHNGEVAATDRATPRSKLAAAGKAREGDRVSDVGNAGDIAHEPLEAEAIPGVRHRAKPSQVKIPPCADERANARVRPWFSNQ